MSYPYRHCIDYCLVEVGEIRPYLRHGFEPFGNVVYHNKHQRCYQALVKYAFKKAPLLPVLTAKEQDCLFGLLQGATYRQIADDLYRSMSYVEKLMAQLKQKFEVKSTRLLIKKAIELGFKPN